MQQWDICPGVVDIARYDILRTLHYGWDRAGCSNFCDCPLSIFQTLSACCSCLHARLKWQMLTGQLWQNAPTDELSVCVWPETWMYSCTGAHQPPSLNHVGPILPDTSALCCRNHEKNPTCTSLNLNTAVAVFIFFLFCLYAVQTNDAKINPHIFFPLNHSVL